MPFDLVVSQTDGVDLLIATGEIDMSNADRVCIAIQETIARPSAHLVLDLSSVTFLDSTGLGALAAGLEAADETGTKISVVSPPRLRKLFAITGFDTAIIVTDTLAAALADTASTT